MDIKRILDLTYLEYVDVLLKKYGAVKENYFTDTNCRNKNKKNSRGKEGIYIHHIDEDKAIMLSTPEYAIKNPFEYQKAERLVYCDLLEHLILHVKIVEFPNEKQNFGELVGVGGIFNFILPELNDIYSGIEYKQDWKKEVVKRVMNRKDEYIQVLTYLINLKKDFPLEFYLRSFNAEYGIWDENNNSIIYNEITDLYNNLNK